MLSSSGLQSRVPAVGSRRGGGAGRAGGAGAAAAAEAAQVEKAEAPPVPFPPVRWARGGAGMPRGSAPRSGLNRPRAAKQVLKEAAPGSLWCSAIIIQGTVKGLWFLKERKGI